MGDDQPQVYLPVGTRVRDPHDSSIRGTVAQVLGPVRSVRTDDGYDVLYLTHELEAEA
jgi:hypothetical protein